MVHGQHPGCKVYGLGLGVQGSGFRVQGLGCMVKGLGCGGWDRRGCPPRAEDVDERTRLPHLGVRHADELLRGRVGVQVRRQCAPCAVLAFIVWGERGTRKTVKARFWPWH